MVVKIKNLTNRPVLLRLNSGQTLHLPPDFLSNEINESLINNNAKVKKLEDGHIILIQQVQQVKRKSTNQKASSKSKTVRSRAKPKDKTGDS